MKWKWCWIIKIQPQWHGIHENVVEMVSGMSLKSAKEDTCSNNAHFWEVFWGSTWGTCGSPTGKRTYKGGIWPKNMIKTGFVWGISTSKNQDSLLKMLRVDLQKYASYIGGEHIFRKVREKSNRKVKNFVKMMLGTSKITHNGIAYIKVSLQWCRVCHFSRPRKQLVAIIHTFARFFKVQLGGHVAVRKTNERTKERYGRKTWPR